MRSTDLASLSCLVLLASAQPACTKDPTAAGCTLGALGDPAKPIEMELFWLGGDLMTHDLGECGPIDIVPPPQGGYVVFVGVRATNLEACGAKISAGLREPGTMHLLSNPDVRSTQFQPIAGRPGWGATAASGDASNGYAYVANLPVCPSNSDRNIPQQLAILEIDVVDKNGKKAQLLQRVFPRCAQQDPTARAYCECTCMGNYDSTTSCANPGMVHDSPDAGMCFPPSDGGAADAAAPADLATSDGH